MVISGHIYMYAKSVVFAILLGHRDQNWQLSQGLFATSELHCNTTEAVGRSSRKFEKTAITGIAYNDGALTVPYILLCLTILSL